MPYETIEVKPATAAIGAEVSGIDLGKPLGNQQFQEVHDALMAHQVLFFRDQKLTLDQHKAFGRLFGELHIHPNTPGPDGHPEILPIHADANSKRINGERWHSDVSCDPEPPMGSILNLKVVPPVGGDTIFASMYAAYDALPSRLKDRLEGRKGAFTYGGRKKATALLNAEDRDWTPVFHPIIRTHPETGRKGLYFDPGKILYIGGLEAAESDALIDELTERMIQPEGCYTHHWRRGDIVIWDNRCSYHKAAGDYPPEEDRIHWRVSIKERA
jgi:taurine dioxygenase